MGTHGDRSDDGNVAAYLGVDWRWTQC